MVKSTTQQNNAGEQWFEDLRGDVIYHKNLLNSKPYDGDSPLLLRIDRDRHHHPR